MSIKNKMFVLTVMLIFLVVSQSQIVPAQTTGNGTVVDYSDNFEDLDVKGQGLVYDSGEFEFDSEDSYLTIGDNRFENIKPSAEDRKANIELGPEGEIKSAHFTTDSGEGIYYINGVGFEAPSNSKVVYSKEEGFELEKGTKINEINSSSIISGENIELPSGEVMEKGSLRFDKEGQAYFEKFRKTKINGATFSSDLGNTSVFFSKPEKDKGDYVYLGDEELVISCKNCKGGAISEDIEVSLGKNNPYVDFEEGDRLGFKVLGDSKVSLNKKQNEDSLPVLETSGRLELHNGERGMRFRDFMDKPGVIHHVSGVDKYGSSVLLKMKSDYFVEGENKTFEMTFNDFNEFYTGGEDNKRIEYKGEGEFLNEIEGKGIPIEFKDRAKFKGIKKTLLRQASKNWNSLTEETKEGIKGITYLDEESFGEKVEKGVSSSAAAYYSHSDSKLYLRIKSGKNKNEVFAHEAAHARHFNMGEGEWDKFKEEWEDACGKYVNYRAEKKGGSYEYEKPFLQRIFGGEEEDEKISKPKYGFINAYGASEFAEDVATFAGHSTSSSYFRDPLMKKDDVSEIYKKKVDLLYKYDFISLEKHNKILETQFSNERE